jgi:hypothetical protein
MDLPDEEREQQERPRPRVVDKRRTSGDAPPAETAAAAPETPVAAEGSPSEVGADPSSAPVQDQDPDVGAAPRVAGPSDEGVWTPEQEEQARRMAEEIAQTPSVEWVVNAAVTLANVAATKLDLGATADAQLAIDALAAMVKEVGGRMGNVEQPLRQTLAQLQMAYAERASSPGTAGP